MRSWFRYAKWLVISALLVAANVCFYSYGYNSGREEGAYCGITAAFSEVANRGYGEWVVVGAREDGRPDAKFHWLDTPACPGGFKLELPPKLDTRPNRSLLKQDDST